MTSNRLPPDGVVAAIALILGVALHVPVAKADDPGCRHAISLVGDPKLPAGYTAFDWVNPDAPKGGTLRLSDTGSYDSLNPFTVQGDAAEGLGLGFDSLFSSSPDEPSTEYGLVAECLSYPDDFSSVTFKLRPEAKFQDGSSVTPEDVIYSLDALKKANPQQALYYKNVVSAEKTGDHTVTFKFDAKGNRELPLIVSQLSVLSKAYWDAKKPNGEERDISKATLDLPLGSGPYKLKSFETGRNIVYARDPNYWARDLPIAKGQWNFDEVRYEYFRDRVPAFEAFKSGLIDVWRESSSNSWATQYGFDAVKTGLIKKELLEHKRVAPMQGFAFNLRRKQFADPRVRHAFNLAFNFEELNRTIFYGAYTRLSSYFDNSELKSTGLPEGREKQLLEEFRGKIPDDLFTTEWKNPVNANEEDLRGHLREAMDLLKAAGWQIQSETVEDPACGFFCRLKRTVGLGSLQTRRIARNASGEALTAEFLIVQPDFERVVLPYLDNLKKIGIDASIRMVDSSQYERRMKSFDFDIAVNSIAQSHSPGNEQRYYFGSAAADRDGSRNVGGIKNPVIDALIDKIVFARNRDELVAATKAMDRVLLWNYYVVPQWHLPADRLAYWDKFGKPAHAPSQDPGRVTQVWWIDEAKAKLLNPQMAK